MVAVLSSRTTRGRRVRSPCARPELAEVHNFSLEFPDLEDSGDTLAWKTRMQ